MKDAYLYINFREALFANNYFYFIVFYSYCDEVDYLVGD